MLTMASYTQIITASAPLGATLYAQIISYTIKLHSLPINKWDMDCKVIKASIYSVVNYFTLTSLTDSIQ